MSIQPSEADRMTACGGMARWYSKKMRTSGLGRQHTPEQADVPILPVHSFRAVSLRREAWWPEAKRRIDKALASFLMLEVD